MDTGNGHWGILIKIINDRQVEKINKYCRLNFYLSFLYSREQVELP